MSSKTKTRVYICSWDSLGFECIVDCTKWEKERLINILAGKQIKDPPVSLFRLTMRARFNPHRNPEIWSFNTTEDLDETTLWDYAKDNPQALADLIRARGECLYKTENPPDVIK